MVANQPFENERPIDSEWVSAPNPSDLNLYHGLEHHVFRSKSMKVPIGYCVLLPPGYEDKTKCYPVVYWLHGGGGNESSSLYTIETWVKLFESKAIESAIIVFPIGRRSGYMDHADGKTLIETMFIQELIPEIDSRFRTISKRSARAIHGFSMGASGALKFSIKYPELFCTCVAYGGGEVDLETTDMDFLKKILKVNLDDRPELIRANNTLYFLKKNGDRVKKMGTKFLMVCGENDSWVQSAHDFKEELKHVGINSELWLIPAVGHEIRKLFESKGEAVALFQNQAFMNPSN